MASIWSKTTQLEPRPALAGAIKTEVAVIGGGMAGVLTARLLEEQGVQAVVLEANRLGSGQTGNTTAKLTAQHGLIYGRLTEQLGEDAARQYAQINQRAIGAYWERAAAWRADCQIRHAPAYLYSRTQEDPLREEAHAAVRLGLEASFTTDTELPFPVRGAVRLEGQAAFHPLQFLAAAARGLTVYEHTRAVRVEGHLVETNGGRVEAEHIVFACHYPFVNAPGYYFLRMHQERSYVVAAEHAARLEGLYYGVDPEGLSLRRAGELLLVGGANHRTGDNQAGGRYEQLRRAGRGLWPESREAAHWSAQDCMTLDGVPYIGPFSASTPHWYVATGFGKWGMSTSMVSAMLLSDLITGRENPAAPVFSPQRFHLAASARTLLEEGKRAAQGLGQAAFEPPRAVWEQLPAGHGGVVEWEDHKAGVYRDDEGEVWAVSVHCPHLGCQVEWNPDEKTWDCPCHGSRFDIRGRLISGPAQTDLARE